MGLVSLWLLLLLIKEYTWLSFFARGLEAGLFVVVEGSFSWSLAVIKKSVNLCWDLFVGCGGGGGRSLEGGSLAVSGGGVEGMEGVGASGGNIAFSAGFSSGYVISRGGIDVGVEAFGAVGERGCSVSSTGLSGMGGLFWGAAFFFVPEGGCSSMGRASGDGVSSGRDGVSGIDRTVGAPSGFCGLRGGVSVLGLASWVEGEYSLLLGHCVILCPVCLQYLQWAYSGGWSW